MNPNLNQSFHPKTYPANTTIILPFTDPCSSQSLLGTPNQPLKCRCAFNPQINSLKAGQQRLQGEKQELKQENDRLQQELHALRTEVSCMQAMAFLLRYRGIKGKVGELKHEREG